MSDTIAALPSREHVQPAPARSVRAALPVLFLVGLAVVWEVGKAVFRVSDFNLPHTYAILAAFLRPTSQGSLLGEILLRAAAVTWFEAIAGFILGGLLGLALAIVFVHSPLLERGLIPYVVMSQTIPILAIAPMVVVWLGTAWFSKAIIAAYLTFFPVTINALRGMAAVDPVSLDLMQSYAASRRQVLLKLRLPNAIPYIFTALKISATASVVGAIVGELPVGSTDGLGPAIINFNQYYLSWPPNLWATILVAAMVGIGFYGLIVLIERRVVAWLPPVEE